jgi:hypothetical protein
MPIATQDVFEAVLARPVTRESGEDESLVHLWWSAPSQGSRIVQIYVDEVLWEVVLDGSQREAWLMLDRSRRHRIELLAVEQAADGWRDLSEHLASWDPPVHDMMTLRMVRDERLPVDARVEVKVDGSVVDEGAVWPSYEHRGGFGALWGVGGFGFDAVTGPGLGMGELGAGPLGADGTGWRWRGAGLAAGSHDLDLRAIDGGGRALTQATSTTAVIETLADAAKAVEMSSAFVLSWNA